MVAVLLSVDDELLERLAVPGDSEDRVLVSLVVPVAAWLDFGHALPRMRESSNTATRLRS